MPSNARGSRLVNFYEDECSSDTNGSSHSISVELVRVPLVEIEKSAAVARVDVLRINFLILRAVWQTVLQFRDEMQTSRTEERQVEYGNSGKHAPLRWRSHAPHGTTDERVPSEQRQRPGTFPHGDSFSRQSARGQSLKPFLPPTRHPSLPQLDSSNDHARFNRSLHQALLAASHRGLLRKSRSRLENKWAGGITRSTPVPRSLSSSGRRGERLRAVAMANVVGATETSLSGRRKNSADGPLHGGQEGGEGGSTSPPHSVALLVLQVAKERALALVFIRLLRLQVYQRKKFLQEVDLRFAYYSQRRVLRAWSDFTKREQTRRWELLRRVVSHWLAVLRQNAARRQVMQRLLDGLHRRRAAFQAVRRRQRQHILLRWMTIFTVRRVKCSLWATAEMFYRTRRRYVMLPGGDHCYAHSVASPLSVLQAAFQHWKAKTEHHLDASLADWQYERLLRQRVLRRCYAWCRQSSRSLFTRDDERGAVAPALDKVNRRPHVAVQSAPPSIMKYKLACARQIAHGALVRCSFDLWHHRLQNRIADRFFIAGARMTVMRRWLQRLAQKGMTHRILQTVWFLWHRRLYYRHTMNVADAFHRRCLAVTALSVWLRRAASQWQRTLCIKRACLQRWWERAALRVGVRALAAGNTLRLFSHWRQRVQRRLSHRTAVLVADSIHETILLVWCFRRWNSRCLDRSRGRIALKVLHDLYIEKQRCRLFRRWKQLAFGPPRHETRPAYLSLAASPYCPR